MSDPTQTAPTLPAGWHRSTEHRNRVIGPSGIEITIFDDVVRIDCDGPASSVPLAAIDWLRAQLESNDWLRPAPNPALAIVPNPALALAAIARQHLGLSTLTTLGSDSRDFSEHAVWSIEAALRAAYEAGRAASNGPASG